MRGLLGGVVRYFWPGSESGSDRADANAERRAQKQMAAQAKRDLDAWQAQRKGRPPPQT